MTHKRCYSELKKLKTFEERFEYLQDKNLVGSQTFGTERYLNQAFYKSKEWKDARNKVIRRDKGCDLGIEDRPIMRNILVHHMNSITEQDVLDRNPDIFNPEYLISVSHGTHNAIHYGDEKIMRISKMVERKPNDQAPWKQ